MRLRDEDLDGHRAAVLVEREVDDLTDTDVTVVDRGAEIQRTQCRRTQSKARARLVGGDHRGFRQPHEMALLLALADRIDGDERTGQQRLQTGHTTGGHARARDPEAGLIGQELLRTMREFGGDDHLGQIVADVDGRNATDVDVLELDLRFAGGKSGGGLEFHGDDRAPFRQGLIGQPTAD